MDKSYCEIIESDFRKIIKQIANEEYNAKLYEEAANVSATLIQLIKIENIYPEKWGLIESVGEGQEILVKSTQTDINTLVEFLGDEISDSEKYLRKYIETKDDIYKTLSKEELHHAQMFLNQLKTKSLDSNTKNKLQDYTLKYNQLISKLQ